MLLQDSRMLQPALQPEERLRSFRRAVADMDFIETLGLSALERANETDSKLNKLMEAIRHEIAYPLLPPVITSLSQEYFHIYPQLNLLFVPPCEGDFLLHLPDLYHELAHPLASRKVQPKGEAISRGVVQSARPDTGLFTGRAHPKRRRHRSPVRFGVYLQTWQQCWIEAWTEEFFCDLFGVYTLGPAFTRGRISIFARSEAAIRMPFRSTYPQPIRLTMQECKSCSWDCVESVLRAKSIRSMTNGRSS